MRKVRWYSFLIFRQEGFFHKYEKIGNEIFAIVEKKNHKVITLPIDRIKFIN